MSYCEIGKCVACGEGMELFGNHHCPPDLEKRKQTANRKAEQDYNLRRPTEAMRLNYGFYLLTLKGDW